MTELFLDIETYSAQDLPKVGVYRYAEDPSFEILMCAWAFEDDPVQVAIGHDQLKRQLADAVRTPRVLKIAHNCQFERICFSSWLGYPTGEYLPPEEWEDTAALAAEAGLPRHLAQLGVALGGEVKDEAGTALINWFCKPDKYGRRRQPEDYPEKWAQFVAYCAQDVVTHRDAYRRMPPWPTGERRVFLVDQKINDRGIAVDRELAAAAVTADEAGRAAAGRELEQLLGIENAGSVPQITKGLADAGLDLPDLKSDNLQALLAADDLTPDQRQAIELRLQISLVAARKYQAALLSCSSDGRLRGQFRFCGAHTTRWSSRGVQIQNLPKLGFTRTDPVTGKKVHDPVAEKLNILDLLLNQEADPLVLKMLLRALFVGPFTVVDYSAIEARGLAWLVGEEWVLEAFRAHRDIYVEQAKRASTPNHPLTRQQGKVATLALGYNGGVGSLRTMGAEGTDAELQALVYQYREANPKIKRSWTLMERAFLDGGQVGRLRVERHGKDRHLVLPAGHSLVYHNVIVAGRGRDRRILFDDPVKNAKTDTYGGRLIENATQAVCRDILAQALVNLEEVGYPTVAHTHDEVIVEGLYSVDEVSRVICQLPSWAGGFPIDAEGFQCERYRKG